MAERCGCYDQGDDIVFGPRHQCTSKPALTTPADLPRFIPSWRFVVPETSEGVAAADLQRELNRLEADPHDLETRGNPWDMDDAERGGY